MNFFSYVVEHDYGLAPNPFGGFCSLAVCKPAIRGNKNLRVGDWVIGTGSEKLKCRNHLINLMRVSEKITFNQYYLDKRFQYKKPVVNGSLVQIFGDNFYFKDPKTNNWKQDLSAHSFSSKEKHIKTDTSSDIVLIAEEYYYFGDARIEIPDDFKAITKQGPGMKYKNLEKVGMPFVEWVRNTFEQGILGDPISWQEYSAILKQHELKF